MHLTSIEASASGESAGLIDISNSNLPRAERSPALVDAGAAAGPVAAVRLIDEPACPEIRSLCSDVPAGGGDEQRTLECVQTFLASQIEALSDECQHAIWRHTLAFMGDKNVVSAPKVHEPTHTQTN